MQSQAPVFVMLTAELHCHSTMLKSDINSRSSRPQLNNADTDVIIDLSLDSKETDVKREFRVKLRCDECPKCGTDILRDMFRPDESEICFHEDESGKRVSVVELKCSNVQTESDNFQINFELQPNEFKQLRTKEKKFTLFSKLVFRDSEGLHSEIVFESSKRCVVLARVAYDNRKEHAENPIIIGTALFAVESQCLSSFNKNLTLEKTLDN